MRIQAITGLVWGLVSLVCVSGVHADHLGRIEKTICQLNTNAHNLSIEIASQYRMTPQFACLSNEAGQILALASQTRELVNCRNVAQLNQNLCAIERLARHVQDELDNVDDLPRFDHWGNRNCRIDTRRAYRLAEDVEDDALDLKDDVRDLPAPHCSSLRPAPQPTYYRSVPSNHGYLPEPVAPGYGTPIQYHSRPSTTSSFHSGSWSSPGSTYHSRPTTGRPAIEFGNGGIRITFGN